MAGENVLAEIGMDAVVARYRALREKHGANIPQTEPASAEAWGQAIDRWEDMGWITPDEAETYRRNVAGSFARTQ
jgi:hypothetical protein